MDTNRRLFIKTAGTGLAGLSLAPAFASVNSLMGFYEPAAFARATPESQGISSEAIRQFLLAAGSAKGVSLHSFMLIRHGKLVAEGWWKPFAPEYIHTLNSLSKSFTSTAIGMLVNEGKLDIQTKLISFFPDLVPADASENLKQITVRHLLTMNSGHDLETQSKMDAGKTNYVKTYLSLPVAFAPGSHFFYNTGNSYMLGAILHKITGQTLEEYLAPRLFKPLGITGYDWATSGDGLNLAGSGLRVRTEDLARFGQTYHQKGIWQGKQIVPANWVQEATKMQTTSRTDGSDWAEGYGYQFWRCTHGAFRGDGAQGQFCIVMPDQDAVMITTGQSADMQKVLTLVWENIQPTMKAGSLPEDASAQAMLKKEIAGLGLAIPKGSTSSPTVAKINKKTFALASNDFGLSDLKFDFSGQECKLTAGASTLLFGWENWLTNSTREPYAFDKGARPSKRAGTATWVNDNTLQLTIRFVEAINGESFTCVFDGDKVALKFTDSRKALEGKLS